MTTLPTRLLRLLAAITGAVLGLVRVVLLFLAVGVAMLAILTILIFRLPGIVLDAARGKR